MLFEFGIGIKLDDGDGEKIYYLIFDLIFGMKLIFFLFDNY
jgi:hypothetical protein